MRYPATSCQHAIVAFVRVRPCSRAGLIGTAIALSLQDFELTFIRSAEAQNAAIEPEVPVHNPDSALTRVFRAEGAAEEAVLVPHQRLGASVRKQVCLRLYVR